MLDLPKAAKSFTYASAGIVALFRSENNAKIHLIAGTGAVAAGFFFGLTTTEWCILVLQIAAVMGAEAVNTAIEKLCDVVSPGHHPVIGQVKDLAAAAVLITAIASVITGLVLFLPKLLNTIS